jgi:hypothetical protein
MSDAQRAELTAAVEELAWTAVREMLQLEPGAGPDLPDADRRQMWLAALNSLLAIRDSAELLASSAALSAAQHGADYPAIGEAAGMTRQGARRKWPGLAGLSDERQRKLAWWARRGEEFTQSVRAVLATSADGSRLDTLRDRLADIESAAHAQRSDAIDLALVDAHAVAVGAPPSADAAAERARGLLAALTADAYAAMNSDAALAIRTGIACGTDGCPSAPIVELWGPELGERPVPVCGGHAVERLGQPGIWLVAAYQPDVALEVFAEAHREE